MSHKNEAILRKTISDERKWGETLRGELLEVLVNNIEKNIDVNIE